jgi:pimeloyl-ACP methyl ester carboxylesterase
LKESIMFLKTSDAEFLISSYGNAKRTLVAHGGWVGSGELWAAPFEQLSRSWRAVTYDHRGTGATRSTAHKITLELLVADLFRVLDALEIDTCVLAAESMGAMVALEAVLLHPDRFSGLVIVGGRYVGTPTPARDRLLAGCKVDFPATMEAFVNACAPEVDCDAERAWGKLIVNRSNGPDAVQLMECVEHVDLTPRLSSITLPTLILHGRKDVIVPLNSSETMASLVPNSKLVIAEDAGHVPTITRPNWVANQIDAFFTR